MTDAARRFALVVLMSMLALSGLALSPVNAAEPEERDSYIVFSGSDGNRPTAIYGTRPGHRTPQRLHSASTNAQYPVFSPDGSMIAFTRSVTPQYRLWVMNADGSNARQVTSAPMVGAASWSPDGTQLVFAGDLVDGTELHIINVDGSGLRRLETSSTSATGPRWAVTGRIYYEHYTGSAPETIHAIDPDGTDDELVIDENPTGFAVSHDGRWIAYGLGQQIIQIVMHDLADGSEQTITNSSGANIPQSFSPDDSRLLFSSTRTSDFASFYTIAPDGSDERGEPIWINRVHEATWGPRVFLDVVDTPYLGDVEWAMDRGLVAGCGIALFCPDRTLTRGEMASFLDRALDPPATTVNHFDDHWHSVHLNALERLAAAGVMVGCGERRACPDALVTRGQAAALLARALDLPRSSVDGFADDDGSMFEGDINRLAAAGIARGCAADRYCPNAALTRAQAMALLHRTLR